MMISESVSQEIHWFVLEKIAQKTDINIKYESHFAFTSFLDKSLQFSALEHAEIQQEINRTFSMQYDFCCYRPTVLLNTKLNLGRFEKFQERRMFYKANQFRW